MEEKPLTILCGPTGVGKSELALALAEAMDAEIVTVDAGQVYKGFDIGTAKPTLQERARIPHHGIDLWEPDQRSDAVLWARIADTAIVAIRARGHRPLLVGGTGFYLRALLFGVFEGPDPDPELRERLQRELEAEGGEAFHRRLREVDPKAAAKIHPNDPVRLLRALEVFEQTGTPISKHQAAHRFAEPRYHYVKLGLDRDRSYLYERINQRVEQMIERGWIDEARALLERWGPKVPPFQLIGYRAIANHLQGELPESELIPTIQQATRNYAKRQLTWFRGESDLQWLKGEEPLRSLVARACSMSAPPA